MANDDGPQEAKAKDPQISVRQPQSSDTDDESEDLIATASDPSLTEDMALLFLKHAELPTGVFERLIKNAAVMHSRKVKVALVAHQRTPRHISLTTPTHLFTFDLMQVALQPQ